MALNLALIWSVVIMLIVYNKKDAIFHVFTENEEVEAMMTESWTMVMVFILFDTMQGVA